MKISFKWLAEFVSHENAFELLKQKRDILRSELPLSGIEIGAQKSLSAGLENVKIAQIASFEKHPKADRLNVCQVVHAPGEQPLQIVCGAPNVRAGMKVALAPVGAILPGNFSIKEAEIRGVKSFGMLCSEKEMGLSEEGHGIMELPDSAPVGSPFVKALGLDDEVWELELTPDRGDCLSHRGAFREFNRFLGLKFQTPEAELPFADNPNEVSLVSVEIVATQACQKYGVQLFEGIQNGPSPNWLRRRLESVGCRSHNTIVDITNFVLFEYGHPIHAFDADKINGSRLIVRFAKQGEKLKTLDAVERTLSTSDLVIADSEGAVALAGVMGGFESSVSSSTQRVFLECAVFDPAIIRSMAKRHKIQTDSSYRFERGVDLQQRFQVVGRTSVLFKQLARARRRGSFVESGSDLTEKQSLNFDLRNFRNVTGLDVPAEELQKALASVDIEAAVRSPNLLKVELPTHRFDLKREIDLVEEGARLVGYQKIPVRYPEQKAPAKSFTKKLYERIQKTRRALLEQGLTEVKPYAFVSKSELLESGLSLDPVVEIENPLSEEWANLRPSLFWGLTKVIAQQSALGITKFGAFDVGSCFGKNSNPQIVAATTPFLKSIERHSIPCKESLHAGWAMLGLRGLEHWSSDKNHSDRLLEVDFFDAKGIFEKLSEALSVTWDPRWKACRIQKLTKTDLPNWIPIEELHPGRSALIGVPGEGGFQTVGYIGELHPLRKKKLLNFSADFDAGVVLGELRVVENLTDETVLGPKGPLKAIPKTPTSRKVPYVHRDLALVVSGETAAGELLSHFKKLARDEIIEVECIDLYPLQDGRKSLAFRFLLQGITETLSEPDIQQSLAFILAEAKKKFGAELR